MATYQELRARSQQVRDEQNIGGNTALRVGQLLMDIVKYFNDNDAAASEYLQQHFAMVNDGTRLLNWQQSPIVILHTMGETYDDGDFSALSQGENYYRAGFIMEANSQGGGINGETPKANVLYVNLANDTLYTWNGASFDAITSGGGGSISGDDIIKNAYYSNGNLVLIVETESGDKTVTIPVTFDASNYVPTSRTVNGKALSNNITLSQSDIPGLVAALAGKISGIKANGASTTLPVDQNGIVELPPAGSTISPATAAPSMDGTAKVGSSAKYAREDHVHPHDTSKQDVLTFDDVPTAGSDNPVKSGGIKTVIDQVTPTINENGKWVIGGVATDKDAQGPRGNTTLVNENAQDIQALIVNNVVDGGETDILSAEMGKVIRQNIMRIFNALGTYAFPEGKPILNWGSTVINHSINVNGVTGGLTISDVEIDGVSAASLPAQIVDGKSLSLKLALPSNLYVFDDGVSVKMGGVDITSTAFSEATGEVNIAEVTDDVVIIATALTYVQDGLVLHLDGKNRGGTTGQWKSLVNYNGSPITFALTGCTENSDNVQFLGNSKGESNSSLPVLFNQGTVEALYDLSGSGFPTSAPQTILCNNTQFGIGLGLVKYSSHPTGFINHTFADNGENLTEFSAYIGEGTTSASKAHVSILQENGVGKLRYNGVAVSDVTLNDKYCQGIDAQTKLSIGNRHRSSGDDYMTGKIFFIRVYSRHLTDTERARNYKIDKQYYGLT